MRGRRESKLAVLLPRVPVSLLGLVLAGSSVQASCIDTDAGPGPDAFADASDSSDLADGPGADSAEDAAEDSPSEDSADDRADGMSYGDGYGQLLDAQQDSMCVSSTVTYPPAPGCPMGNYIWACWKPTSAVGGIPVSNYSVVSLCGDVVVIDTNTKLMWGQEGEPGTYTWVAAAAACQSSRRAGFSDWRLPSSNELMSLVDYSSSTAILSPVFKNVSAAIWSSTSAVQQSGYAWQLYGSGGVYPQVVSDLAYVRCVR
jgi:hypothetical protein